MTTPRCLACSKRVPWFSLFGNLSLGIYKVVVGVLGGSSALIADGFHSLADVVGSTCILVTCRISDQPPDDRHPYGHGKAEFLGAIFVYTVLLFFSAGIMIGGFLMLHSPRKPHLVTILGAVISVFYNYLMYRYSECAGTRCNSPGLMADAFENRADAMSSVATIVGIAAAVLIHPVCDPLAAIAVGLIILWNCITQLRTAAAGLMDRGMSEEEVAALERAARAHDGVVGVEFVRTRQTGPRFWLDLGIRVSDELTVSESDAISAAIREDLSSNPQLHQVEVFVVPSSVAAETRRAPVALRVLRERG